MSFKSLTGAIGAGVLLAAATAATAAAPPANIAAAVADAGRPAADTALDAGRKPAELLTFAGIKPGMTVVDVFPGAYWERLFAKAVGPTGKVFAFWPAEMVKAENVAAPANGSHPDAANPNITAVVAPVNKFPINVPADVIWIRQNYHDLYDPFMGPADVPAFNKTVFNTLKHGGLYVIIDHSAPDGSGLAGANTTHRIDAAVVKKDMAAAGFKFVGESNVLRNPDDKRDKLVFDKSIRGKTDQFVYVFKRP